MTLSTSPLEPKRVDEPQLAEEYASVLSRVAAEGQAVIVQRGGADLAAVIPLEYLKLVRELLAVSAAEKLAAQIDWTEVAKAHPPAQEWFDGDEPKLF
ncbi:MAG: hypothetical protein K2R98_09775 [Gemmataceae bacterium]|nr:hypothetical protein [Gemmataceae bacterium]